MRRWVWRAVGAVTALIFVLIMAGWLILRASLPQLDGELAVVGLTSPTTIERDAAGIPVISAVNRIDLAFATGFAHGQDRFFQMDLTRRQAAGELSEMVGPVALSVDTRSRFHRLREKAIEVVAASSEKDRRLLQRYAQGVNAGRESLRARPFEYFVLGVEPQAWRAEDSILVVYAMFLQLNDSRADKDIQRGWVHDVVAQVVYDWMYPEGSPWDAPLMGLPRIALLIPDAATISLRGVSDNIEVRTENGGSPLRGSNNWAVSGAHTASGRALVSDDMHLGLNTPNIFYRARLVVTGDTPLDVSGVMLPGIPFVVAGSNRRIAWGFTNSYGDFADAVIVVPGETTGTYQTMDGDRDIQSRVELINVKGKAPVEFEIRDTIWGPIRENLDFPTGEIAVRWTAHLSEAVNLDVLKLESAGSVEEALDIANRVGMPPQNFVVGDADGDIGWTIAGKIPLRTDFDPMLPADWSQQRGWSGWLPAAEYPRIVNPPSGRLWTANTRVADGEALHKIGNGGYALGARARQIRDRLFAKETFDAEEMLRIQVDDAAVFLTPWRDLLLRVLSEAELSQDPQLLEYQHLIANWVPRATPDSVGYRLVRAFRLSVHRRLFHSLTAAVREVHGEAIGLRMSNQFEAAVWSLLTEQPMHMLPGKYQQWDDFLLDVVRSDIEYYEGSFEGALADRNWGEINTAAIRHPLASSIPILGKYLNMPVEPLSGDANMPKAQGPAFGASERFSVMPGDEENSLLQMPTGASGHPLSPFYAAGHTQWVNGSPSPFLPGAAVHKLTLSPSRR